MTHPPDASPAPLALEVDGTGTALYVRVSTAAVARTTDLGDDVLVDHDVDGGIVGFEIVGLHRERVARVLARLRERYVRSMPALASLALFSDAPPTP